MKLERRYLPHKNFVALIVPRPAHPIMLLLTSCQQTCMTYTIAVCAVKTLNDGQKNCLKHVEFRSKNKFEKLVHLVGFIIKKKLLIRCFCKSAKGYSYLNHLCLLSVFVSKEQLLSHWSEFHEICYLRNFGKYIRKIQI